MQNQIQSQNEGVPFHNVWQGVPLLKGTSYWEYFGRHLPVLNVTYCAQFSTSLK